MACHRRVCAGVRSEKFSVGTFNTAVNGRVITRGSWLNRYSLGRFICEEPYSNLDCDTDCELSRDLPQTPR